MVVLMMRDREREKVCISPMVLVLVMVLVMGRGGKPARCKPSRRSHYNLHNLITGPIKVLMLVQTRCQLRKSIRCFPARNPGDRTV